jgi:glycosyltransferase involved in cell wall biosynthesis
VRLAIVGSFADEADEGCEKITSRTAQALAARHQIERVSNSDLVTSTGLAALASFRPDVIHLFSAPLRDLALAKWSLRRRPSARLVITAMHPELMHLAAPPFVWALRCTRPDVVVVQSRASEKMFREAGTRVAWCPNGVDAGAFHPVNSETRRARKSELGLDPDRVVVLHVGHLTAKRKLHRLLPLAAQCQLVVVTSRHFPELPGLRSKLEGAGARMLDQFFPEIARVYQAADCYVFPVDYGDSTYQPLSILEALACGLPVVSMPYPSLQECADLAPHVRVASDERELVSLALDVARRGISARCDVPTWDEVAIHLEGIYAA